MSLNRGNIGCNVFKTAILIGISVMFSSLYSQPSLVYFKNYQDSNNGRGILQRAGNAPPEAYIMVRQYLQSNADVGIWSDDLITNINPLNTTAVFYNEGFEYQGHINLPSTINGMGINFKPIGLSDSIYYFRGNTLSTSNLDFSSTPPMQSTQLYSYANNLIFGYDINAEIINPVDHWRNIITTVTLPYWGYGDVMSSFQSIDLHHSATFISNERIVSALPFFGNHENNWGVNYDAIEGHRGYLWNTIDLTTGTNEVVQVISPEGNVETRAIYYSPEQDAIYRIGMVRGHNTKISPLGSSWLTTPGDSTYYTFLARENAEGNQQWSIPIYGFSNANPDTVNPNGPDFLSFQSGTQSFAELNENLFFSHSSRLSFSSGDTVYFKDIFGNTHVCDAMIPGNNCAFSSRCVYKISLSGEPVAKISYDLELNSSHPNILSGNNNAFKEHIFKIGNKLAWINLHQNTDGNSALFKREMSNGDISLIENILPAGKSISISWLNDELEFLDFWTIPFETSGAAPKIEFMTQYQGDTLLIQGNTHGLTSCNYDPSGIAPVIETPINSTFIAFYSGLNSLGSRTVESKAGKLKVYPNPSGGIVNISAPYTIHRIVVSNLLGQPIMILEGMNQTERVDLGRLAPGVYLLTAEGSVQKSTARVMLQH